MGFPAALVRSTSLGLGSGANWSWGGVGGAPASSHPPPHAHLLACDLPPLKHTEPPTQRGQVPTMEGRCRGVLRGWTAPRGGERERQKRNEKKLKKGIISVMKHPLFFFICTALCDHSENWIVVFVVRPQKITSTPGSGVRRASPALQRVAGVFIVA